MNPLGWINGIWVLALALGLTGASCTVQVITDHRPPTADRRSLTASEPDAATKAQVQAAYGKLPLHFEANQGQSDKQVKFLSRGRGYTLFLTPTEAVLALRQLHKNTLTPISDPSLSPPSWRGRTKEGGIKGPEPELTQESPRPRFGGEGQGEGAVLRMQLVGANPHPQVVGLEELPGKSNYFIGNDPTKWRTNIPTYTQVKYPEVYPGVDLVYYGNQRQLEHDFIVTPGANPQVIKLAFEGADKLEIDAQGDLILHSQGEEVRLLKPRIYQEVNGVQQPIPGGYVLFELETRNSKPETQTVGFQVAAYDTSKPLIIDPVLEYSTYLGGSSFDRGLGIAVDSDGNAYVTGQTNSPDFPTASPFQPANGGGGASDAFVTKLNAAGDTLVYSTYLGGSSQDEGFGIVVGAFGDAYVTGLTYSTNFPTASAFQATYGGGIDAFATKLNAAGSVLVYSTYLGGSDFDGGFGIDVNAFGNAYVIGYTNSTDFPTASPFQPANGGGEDAFVTKLNAAGSALTYSTYFGSSSQDRGFSIAVDASGNAYVTGFTQSDDFPTVSPLQATRGGPDAFVAKLNATGSALSYSTYLGGSTTDEGCSIAVDTSGNAYVAGHTNSTDFPTASAFQAAFSGGLDAFVTKINAAGSALVYSTYLGGSGADYSCSGFGSGIAVDAFGNAYVTGYTDSINFPTESPFQATLGGSFDAFVTKINAAGSALVYSTYLGGIDDDRGFDIAVDPSGNAYVTGWTNSPNFPTASAFQATNGGSFDAFVAKLGQEICPATAALAGAPQEEAKLGVLYDFRDEVLASTPTGERYIELFYRHAAEEVGLMFSYPELLSHARTLLERFLPTIQAVVAGQKVTVTAADLADIEALLEAFAAKASPELQADLRAIQEELQEGTIVREFGITLRD